MAITSKDITHTQGLAPQEYFIIKNLAGSPLDISNYTAEINIKAGFKPGAPLIESFSNTNTKLKFHDSILGRIDFNFDGSEFNSISIKSYTNSYRYDFLLIDDDGTSRNIFDGSWIIKTNI